MSEMRLEKVWGELRWGASQCAESQGLRVFFPQLIPTRAGLFGADRKALDCQTRSADTAQYGVTQSESAEEKLLMHTSHVNAQTNTPSTHECREQLKTFTVMYLDIMKG